MFLGHSEENDRGRGKLSALREKMRPSGRLHWEERAWRRARASVRHFHLRHTITFAFAEDAEKLSHRDFLVSSFQKVVRTLHTAVDTRQRDGHYTACLRDGGGGEDGDKPTVAHQVHQFVDIVDFKTDVEVEVAVLKQRVKLVACLQSLCRKGEALVLQFVERDGGAFGQWMRVAHHHAEGILKEVVRLDARYG